MDEALRVWGTVKGRSATAPSTAGYRVHATVRRDIEPTDDVTDGRRVRLTGRVVESDGGSVPADLPVVLWGVDRDEGAAPPRAVVVTESFRALAGRHEARDAVRFGVGVFHWA